MASPVTRTARFPGLTPADVFGVVVDFSAYPQLFPEIKEATVLSTEGRRVRAEFKGNIVVPFRYVLDLDCDEEGFAVTWTTVEGHVVKRSEGGWRFTVDGDGTKVQYTVSLDIEAPVPGFLLRKITDGLLTLSLPAMFASVEREARARRAAKGKTT